MLCWKPISKAQKPLTLWRCKAKSQDESLDTQFFKNLLVSLCYWSSCPTQTTKNQNGIVGADGAGGAGPAHPASPGANGADPGPPGIP